MLTRLFVFILIIGAGAAHAGGEVHWGYSGDNGPENWATLCADFGECAGHNQSPINLTGFVDTDLLALITDYKAGGFEIINNGHTVGVHYDKGSVLTMDGIDFTLLQFHFHAPSENQIEGKNLAMEVHLVHQAEDGSFAVVAIMVEKGDENEALSKLWAEMPKAEGTTNPLPAKFNIDSLLPAERAYYRYNGSFTTPPCTEGVRWFVLQDSITFSNAQVEAFTEVMGHPNNRPVQPTNARLILE